MVSIKNLQEALEWRGLDGAVALLNDDVPHRFTGLFLAEGSLLRNVALHDKEVERPALWEPFPLQRSFCSVAIATRKPLAVTDANHDPRDDVREHAASDTVLAYCGVPILDREGSVLGTLCHFDYGVTPATDIDLEQMLQLPALILPYLPGQGSVRGG